MSTGSKVEGGWWGYKYLFPYRKKAKYRTYQIQNNYVYTHTFKARKKPV
jgi:hypothetical protein